LSCSSTRNSALIYLFYHPSKGKGGGEGGIDHTSFPEGGGERKKAGWQRTGREGSLKGTVISFPLRLARGERKKGGRER